MEGTELLETEKAAWEGAGQSAILYCVIYIYLSTVHDHIHLWEK
jgi:hypothetical protein